MGYDINMGNSHSIPLFLAVKRHFSFFPGRVLHQCLEWHEEVPTPMEPGAPRADIDQQRMGICSCEMID